MRRHHGRLRLLQIGPKSNAELICQSLASCAIAFQTDPWQLLHIGHPKALQVCQCTHVQIIIWGWMDTKGYLDSMSADLDGKTPSIPKAQVLKRRKPAEKRKSCCAPRRRPQASYAALQLKAFHLPLASTKWT